MSDATKIPPPSDSDYEVSLEDLFGLLRASGPDGGLTPPEAAS